MLATQITTACICVLSIPEMPRDALGVSALMIGQMISPSKPDGCLIRQVMHMDPIFLL